MRGLFDWRNYETLLDKADRDLATLRSQPEHPFDAVFNLVVTVDHICDWVTNDDELVNKHAEAEALCKNVYVRTVHGLSIGAKHFKPTNPVADIETATYGWGEAAWGSSPWGGGYFVEVDGAFRNVVDVAAEALKAWRDLLA